MGLLCEALTGHCCCDGEDHDEDVASDGALGRRRPAHFEVEEARQKEADRTAQNGSDQTTERAETRHRHRHHKAQTDEQRPQTDLNHHLRAQANTKDVDAQTTYTQSSGC